MVAIDYMKIVESSLNEIYIFSASTLCFLDVNRGARENLGYTLEELQELTPLDIKPEYTSEQFETLIHPLRQREREKIEFNTYHRRKDGTTYPVEVHLQLRDFDAEPIFVAIIVDTSERDELFNRSMELGRIFQRSLNEVYIYDIETLKFLEVNEGARNNIGYSMSELNQMSPVDLKPEYTIETYEELIRPLRNQEIDKVEFKTYQRRKDGTNYIVEVHLHRSTFDGKDVMVAIILDITQREEAEAKLLDVTMEAQNAKVQLMRVAKEAAEQANEAKSAFIAHISHELRTPLNSILGFSHLLERESSLPSQHQEYLNHVIQSGEYLLGLINDILELAKIEAGKIELHPNQFDLHEVIYSLQSLYEAKTKDKGLNFELHVEDNVPQYVLGDQNKVRQILINLLSNAYKYTDTGEITLSVWQEQSGNSLDDYHMFFAISDTGVGIAENELNLLFQPFSQTASGRNSMTGTGLGLALVKQFVELMKGTVSIESKENVGTTVEFNIHLLSGTETLTTSNNTRSVKRLAPNQPEYHMIVADDQEENRKLLSHLLQSVGFKVQESTNGMETVQLWRECLADIIFMDMNMPLMNGQEATRIIRTMPHGDQVKIIAVTAHAFDHERQEMMQAGCDDYVMKPLDENKLFDVIQQQLQVDFEYAEKPIKPETIVQSQTPIPSHLRTRLEVAVDAYSLEQVIKVVEDIKSIDTSLAHRIRQLAQEFDFTSISNMLESDDS